MNGSSTNTCGTTTRSDRTEALRYHDLGADYHTSRIDKTKKARNHVRQLEALGYTVTLAPAA